MLKSKRFLFVLATLVTLNVALWIATAAFSLPRTMLNYFLGPKMIRSEILVWTNGAPRDYLLDQGRIRSVDRVASTITLKERDSQIVTIPVDPNAKVTLNGKPATFLRLRAGMQAYTVRDPDKATQIFATKSQKK